LSFGIHLDFGLCHLAFCPLACGHSLCPILHGLFEETPNIVLFSGFGGLAPKAWELRLTAKRLRTGQKGRSESQKEYFSVTIGYEQQD
jgi:hypothetical protein